jgi:hypothetical protein
MCIDITQRYPQQVVDELRERFRTYAVAVNQFQVTNGANREALVAALVDRRNWLRRLREYGLEERHAILLVNYDHFPRRPGDGQQLDVYTRLYPTGVPSNEILADLGMFYRRFLLDRIETLPEEERPIERRLIGHIEARVRFRFGRQNQLPAEVCHPIP